MADLPDAGRRQARVPRLGGEDSGGGAVARWVVGASAVCEGEGREMSIINPPGPDWHDRVLRRFREALRRSRLDECAACRAEGVGFRHWAYPSECPGTSG